MLLRHALAGLLALAVTFGLFYLMQLLISMGSERGASLTRSSAIEFVRLERESELELRKRELPRKQKPPEPPPPPELEMAAPEGPDTASMAIAAPPVEVDVDLAGDMNLGTAPSDTDSVPLVRVLPQYPIRASERGIEGWVVVRFTISPTGTVKDPIVVDSQPTRIFDRAAIQAIKKWKYKPKVENGVAVERPNVDVKLTFDLDGD